MRGVAAMWVVGALLVAAEARATSCSDAIQNGAETDVDCGGPACGRCATGQRCVAPTDCVAGVCAGGRCVPPTCADLVKNGDETDVDCGGSCAPCSSCACLLPGDCASNLCVACICYPSACADRVKNGTETDVDCGGPGCPRCDLGRVCSQGSDCGSGICSAATCALPLVDAGRARDAEPPGAGADANAGEASTDARAPRPDVAVDGAAPVPPDSDSGVGGAAGSPSSQGGAPPVHGAGGRPVTTGAGGATRPGQTGGSRAPADASTEGTSADDQRSSHAEDASGCGCRAAKSRGSAHAVAIAFAALAVFGRRRRGGSRLKMGGGTSSTDRSCPGCARCNSRSAVPRDPVPLCARGTPSEPHAP